MNGLNDLQVYDFLRIITAVVAVITAYRLGQRAVEDHKTYSTRLSEWVWVIFLVQFTLFEGALENVLRNTEYRYGTVLSFFIAVASLHASRRGEPLQQMNAEQIEQMLKDGTLTEDELRHFLNPNDPED